jgi:hypothetical protein
MLSPNKKDLEEYKPLVVKMNNDLHAILAIKTILEFLCDVEVIMASIASCPCWRKSMNLSSLLKARLVFLVTLLGF